MCRWCWAFPRWSVNTRAISWAPIPLFSLFQWNVSLKTLVGHHSAVCAGEHDLGGDGGHLDHHLHRRDRSWLSLPNQLRCAEAVSPGKEPTKDAQKLFKIFLWCVNPQHLESGLMEVISPPSEFYPDLAGLRKTLGKDFSEFWVLSMSNIL